MKTKRIEDINGWIEIKKNPISKVGVFPYLGRELQDPENPDPRIIDDKIYMVARLPEELGSEATMKSMQLLPWIDEHVPLLGSEEEGFTPPEEKGVHGTTGQDVIFEDGTLSVNIKLWSDSMGDEIDINGKRELSLGYRCTYEFEDGIFDGKRYELVQRNIRGNHLALVKEGRMGKDVAVQDGKPKFIITLDSKEIVKMKKTPEQIKAEKEARAAKTKKFTTMCDSALASFKQVTDAAAEVESGGEGADIGAFMKMFKEFAPMLTEFMNTVKKIATGTEPDGDEPAVGADSEGEDPTDGDQPSDKGTAAMDKQIETMKATIDAQGVTIAEMQKSGIKSVMSVIAERDSLYKQVSPIIGAFDHALLTPQEIAEKALAHESINIQCEKGTELATLKGFLAASDRSPQVILAAGDSKASEGDPSELDAFLATQV